MMARKLHKTNLYNQRVFPGSSKLSFKREKVGEGSGEGKHNKNKTKRKMKQTKEDKIQGYSDYLYRSPFIMC